MATPVPVKIRETIVRVKNEHPKMTYEQIAKLVNVGPATVSRILGKARREQSLEPKPMGGVRVVKVDNAGREWLAGRVREEPDLTLERMAEEFEGKFGVSVVATTILNALRKLGFTLKKNPSAPARRTPIV